MRGYTLTNVLDPAEAQDVATKEYADKMVNNVGKYVDEKNAILRGRWMMLKRRLMKDLVLLRHM